MAGIENGYIKLHRSMLSWEWNDDPHMMSVFIHCLLLANWKDKRWHGMIIERGTFLTSHAKLASACGITTVTCRRCLKKLCDSGEISLEVTHRGTRIKVHNYAVFQDIDASDMTHQVSHQISRQVCRQVSTTEERKESKELKEYKYIVSFLNETTHSSFKITPKTKSLIDARLREGFTVDDFKKVIETKTAEWKDTDMQKYLRPSTLFGTKFESYLQQKPVPKQMPDWYNPEPVRQTDQVPATAEEIEATRRLLQKGMKA